MKKGISPLIAILLLMLISLSLGGAFMVWVNRAVGGLTSATETQVETGSEFAQKTIVIESVVCDDGDIWIRNTGAFDIEETDIAVYHSNILVTSPITYIGFAVPPRGVGQIDTTEVFTGKEVRVTVPGGFDIYDDC